MKRTDSLKKNAQFQYVYRRGKGISDAILTLIYVKNRQTRVGIVISKKIGNAVLRNKLKRRLRMCFTPLLPKMERGYYVAVVRKNAAEVTYQELDHSVLVLLKRRKWIKDSVPAGSRQDKKMEEKTLDSGSDELSERPSTGTAD